MYKKGGGVPFPKLDKTGRFRTKMPGTPYTNPSNYSTRSADFLICCIADFQSARLSIALASQPPFGAWPLKFAIRPRAWLPPFLLFLLVPSAPPRLCVASVPCPKRDFSGLGLALTPQFSEQTRKTFRDPSHFSNHVRRIQVRVGVPPLGSPISCNPPATH